MTNITQEYLKELLEYKEETGAFRWRVKKSTNTDCTKRAGYINNRGYWSIGIDGKYYLQHRLAHLYMEGVWPTEHIDHINRVTEDNRWCNLREATRSQNHRNRKNNVAFTGVYKSTYRVDRWIAHDKNTHIGTFKTHLAACYAKWYKDLIQEVQASVSRKT